MNLEAEKVRFPFSKVLIHNWCNTLWNNSVLEKSNEWKAEIIPNYSPYIAIWLHWSYCIVRYSCYCILYLYASLNPLAKSTLTAFRVLFVSTGHLYIIYFFLTLAYDVFLIEKQESKIDKSVGFSLCFEVISDRNDIFRETK